MASRIDASGLDLTSVDTAEWDSAYRSLAPTLHRYLRKVAGDDATADDLLQDCFIRAMSAARVPDLNEMRPWLFRIATNLAIDHLRRRRRFAFLSLRGVASVEGHAIEESDHIRRALRSIPADQAVALVLRIDSGFTTLEVAQILGVSESAMRARVARGRLNFVAAYRRIAGGLTR